MKTLITIFIFFCISSLSFAAQQAGIIYDGAVLNEDVTWSGVVLVRGAVVVAPQATLRIEPGTVVNFAVTAGAQIPTLVIQGRINAAGDVDHPIILTSERSKQPSWGGIVFLSTEKRNLLEHCRIENADVGIDVRFSTVTLNGVTILNARTAILSNDAVIQASDCSVSDSETGVKISDTEFEGRRMSIASCLHALIASRSAIMLVSPKIINNKQAGFEADECRIKITDGEFSGNAQGVYIKGGEGQISMSKFLQNSLTALHLKGTRIKIQRCLFADNSQDALRTEDGRALLLNNAFSSNGGFNLYNAGVEVVSVRQNWWGSVEKNLIFEKIFDVARDRNVGAVQISPWLNEKPKLMP